MLAYLPLIFNKSKIILFLNILSILKLREIFIFGWVKPKLNGCLNCLTWYDY